jgi:hypothetical protein
MKAAVRQRGLTVPQSPSAAGRKREQVEILPKVIQLQPMPNQDPRVDAYIAQAADFAKPVLNRIRKLVHAPCPDVTETIKRSTPFYEHKGILLATPAFKKHCALIFRKGRLIFSGLPAKENPTKALRRITAAADLPDDEILTGYIRKAVELNEAGIKTPARAKPKAKREIALPDYFLAALKKIKKALAGFASLSPSCRREYVEWIGVARLALALLIGHAPFLRAGAAELAYTPVEVPLAPVSKPLINDKGQVLTVVTSTVYMYLPTADYGLEAGVHPRGAIAAGGVVMDFNSNGHFVTRFGSYGQSQGSLYKDGAVFTFPTPYSVSAYGLGLDQLGRVLFQGDGNIREVDGSVTTVPGLGGAFVWGFFNDINDASIAVGYIIDQCPSPDKRQEQWSHAEKPTHQVRVGISESCPPFAHSQKSAFCGQARYSVFSLLEMPSRLACCALHS